MCKLVDEDCFLVYRACAPGLAGRGGLPVPITIQQTLLNKLILRSTPQRPISRLRCFSMGEDMRRPFATLASEHPQVINIVLDFRDQIEWHRQEHNRR